MRLLDRSLRRLALYAATVLLLSVPGYYFMVRQLWMGSVDTGLAARRTALEHGLNEPGTALTTSMDLLQRVQPGVRISAMADPLSAQADSTYTTVHPLVSGGEDEQFRCLASVIHVQSRAWRLVLEEEVEETDEVVAALVGVTAVFLVLLLVGSIILNKRFAQRAWQPFTDTLHVLRTHDITGPEALMLAPSDIKEFEELNAALVKLAERAAASYREQKEFTENAAHEMQTPIALLRSRVDVLMQTDGLTEDQAMLLQGAQRTLERLTQLHRDLLLLSRMEAGARTPGSIDPARLIEETLASLAEQAALQGIALHSSLLHGTHLSMAPAWANSLFTNLLGNAIRHNHTGGRVVVHLDGDHFCVSNTGAAQPLDGTLLFQRFQTFGARRKGHGLGLAIAKRIAEMHGLSLRYDHIDGMHRFTLDLVRT